MLRSGGNFAHNRKWAYRSSLPSMAIQSAKDECDINVLVKRFGITGTISGVQRPPPLSEFGEIFDFQSAMDTINAANRAFMSMDADTRYRFRNDPGLFVKFCSEVDGEGKLVNLAEMRKMGLAVPEVVPVVPEPVRVQVVNPAPAG